MSKTELIKLLMLNAKLVHKSCLVGNPCQDVAERYERISSPKPGDLVLEMSAQRKWEYEPENSIGRLIMVRDEPIKHIEWGEEPKPLETYYYIETLDGRLYQWYDCVFIVVSEKNESKREGFYSEDEERESWVRSAMLRHNLSAKGVGE